MLDDFVTKSSNRIKTVFKEIYAYNQVFVYTKDPLSDRIDLQNILDKVESKVPVHIGQLVDSIMIGDFPQLRRDPPIIAFYEDGSLYVTNDPPSPDAMLKAIVHEFAHAVEEAWGLDIYGDGQLESEFTKKRIGLRNKFKDYNVDAPSLKTFMNVEYSQEFDDYLYDLGYEKINNLMTGMFLNPYSVTSLREYFATGFEEFMLGDKKHLIQVCPVLYDKILSIVRLNER
jgi:hypothetical protein